jgi:hypothetical protein
MIEAISFANQHAGGNIGCARAGRLSFSDSAPSCLAFTLTCSSNERTGMEKVLDPIELNDSELAAVAGGCLLDITTNINIVNIINSFNLRNSANSFQANNSGVSNSASSGHFHFG